MVACYGPHEGPWLRSRGNETGIRITCLGQGEHVVACYQNGTSEVHELVYENEGIFPFPKAVSRISFKKHGGISPTSVELIVG